MKTKKRNCSLFHMFFKLVMSWTYRRSRDKEKRNVHNWDLDIVRIQRYAKDKKIKWTFVNDRLFGAANFIQPPTLTNVLVAGDCDDFASSILGRYEEPHNAYLFTYFPKKVINAHTVPVFKLNDEKIVLINWGKTYLFDTVEEMLTYIEENIAKSPIKSCHFAQWSQLKYKYVATKLKKYQYLKDRE